MPGKMSNDLVERRPYRDNEKAKWWDDGEKIIQTEVDQFKREPSDCKIEFCVASFKVKITECQDDNICVACKTTSCCKFKCIVPETKNMPSN